MLNRKRTVALGSVVAMAGLLALAAPAEAHVSVSSTNATQGGYATVTFKVPNEEANASTTKLVVQLPSDTPFASASTQPIPGWTATLKTTKLAKPITTDDGEVSEGVSQITWTADRSAAIRPGQFQQFNISLGPLPSTSSITFKALQTYSNGEVVRWIQTPAPGSSEEPDYPAPTLALAASSGDDHHSASSAAPSSDASPVAESSSDSGGGDSNTAPLVLSIVAVVLAAGALGLGVVNRARRQS